MVKRRTEIKFLIMWGETRISERNKFPRAVGIVAEPVAVTGSKDPLPTIILDGVECEGRVDEVSIPEFDVIWDEAPESIYQSVVGGGVNVMVLKLFARVAGSQGPRGPGAAVGAEGWRGA